MDNFSTWARDTIERVVRTVLALVVGAALVAFTETIRGSDEVSVDTVSAALYAAYVAASTAFFAWVAKLKEGTISPASLVKA